MLRWTEMLVQCQDNVEKLFASLSRQQISPEIQSITDAGYRSSAILDAVFQNGLLEILLTDDLALDLRKKYADAVGKSRRPMLDS